MTDATTEFFDELGRRAHEPLLEKVDATIRFEIVKGKQKRRWLVSIDAGDISVSRRNDAATATIRVDQAMFDRLVRGEANATAAVLRGSIRVEGDLEPVILFQRVFAGPPLGKGKR
jgi:putative sterol carrier protein